MNVEFKRVELVAGGKGFYLTTKTYTTPIIDREAMLWTLKKVDARTGRGQAVPFENLLYMAESLSGRRLAVMMRVES